MPTGQQGFQTGMGAESRGNWPSCPMASEAQAPAPMSLLRHCLEFSCRHTAGPWRLVSRTTRCNTAPVPTQLPAMHTGRRQRTARLLGPLHPDGRPRWGSRVPASLWQLGEGSSPRETSLLSPVPAAPPLSLSLSLCVALPFKQSLKTQDFRQPEETLLPLKISQEGCEARPLESGGRFRRPPAPAPGEHT